VHRICRGIGGLFATVAVILLSLCLLPLCVAALAQATPPQATPPQAAPAEASAYLVRKDQSSCPDSGDVTNANSPQIAGFIRIARLSDGNVTLTVSATARPNTTYRFAVTCGAEVANIVTDDEGVANITIPIPVDVVRAPVSFEMSAKDTAPETRFQSAQIAFR
jgi:hypothetical protein